MAKQRRGYNTSAGAPTSGYHEVGARITDGDGVEWVCTVAGEPGTFVNQGTASDVVSGAGVHIGDALTMYRTAPFDGSSGGFAIADVAYSEGTTIAFDDSAPVVDGWGNGVVRVTEDGAYTVHARGEVGATASAGVVAAAIVSIRVISSMDLTGSGSAEGSIFDASQQQSFAFQAIAAKPECCVTVLLAAGTGIEINHSDDGVHTFTQLELKVQRVA